MPTGSSLAIAAAIMATAAGGATAYGMHQQGQAASRAASVEAEMQRRKGIQEFALSQEKAKEQKRQKELLQSEAIAQSAAFGGGTEEMATVNKLLDIEQRGEYNALSELYSGATRKQDLDYGSNLTTYKGRSARRSANIQSFATVLDAASSIASIGASLSAPKGA